MDREAKIKELEAELSKTKYNKATQHHVGLVKAKIAKLKDEVVARASGGKKGLGYAVRKTGDATVALVGFPSVGKSTLLNKLTSANSKTAAYAFTTLTVVPGVMDYRGAQIQILDIPGIVQGAAAGTGRGKEVIGVIRTADLIIIIASVLDLKHANVLEKELYDANVRLNSSPPQIIIKPQSRGGIKIGATCKLTHLDADLIESILREFRIINADVVIREDATVERFIDAIEGNKSYIPSLLAINKMDMVDSKTLEQARREFPHAVFISAEKKKNLDEVKDRIYDGLELIRIFLKQPDRKADVDKPMIMRKNTTVKIVCEKIHRDFINKFKFARVWGKSAKFPGQKFMFDHKLTDEDVLQLHIK